MSYDSKGIIAALGACFLWGLIFVIPYFMTHFSSIEIVIGRYITYGTLSLSLFLLKGRHQYPLFIWKRVLIFSLFGTILYYTFLVLGIRHSSPAICALIAGLSPITIALYGNFHAREIHFKHLLFPSFLILIGLIAINAPELLSAPSAASYSLGLFFATTSLLFWSWYVVANSRFLKLHPNISAQDWSVLLGISCLFWTFILISIGSFFLTSPVEFSRFFSLEYLLGSLILGFFCSFLGAILWNTASVKLPVSLSGQLSLFETIFGVLFFYLFTQTLPSLIEVFGICILLSAIVYTLRKF